MPTALWTADRRIYLDAAGRAVEAKDPRRVTLLVAEGGQIPLEQAQALGLLAAPAKTAPANKGRKAPANKGE